MPSMVTSTTSPLYQRAHALRSAGRNQVAGQQGAELRDVVQDAVDGEHHVPRVAVLAQLAVDAGLHLDAVG